ncbi:MAG: DNA polymerase III subunit beta [Geobacteraceae bacterium]|nr:DNA polymerase III subunit beta [Geobacteraceae bacterium]
MEFTIEKETFVKALQKIQGIVERRNTMPILSNVLIEASDNNLTFTATDLEVGMKSSYKAKVLEEGRITLSAKKLYEIIRELPDEQVKLTTKGNDWVDITCGKAKFSIVGLSPDEFPFFPKINETGFVTLDSSTLARMIEQTSYAICHDETKYNLNGILFKISNKEDGKTLVMVATDGHRLSVSEHKVEGADFDIQEKGVIFPKKGIIELKKLCDEEESGIRLGFVENSIAVIKNDTTVVMRLVDGEFPDYTRVVPVGNNKEITIKKDIFLHSLKRMAILSSEKFKGIKFEIANNSIVISSSNPELGEAREELDAKYSGENMVTRFNARYLIDVLNIITEEEVVLLLRDEMSPAILKKAGTDELMAVIMPMRL